MNFNLLMCASFFLGDWGLFQCMDCHLFSGLYSKSFVTCNYILKQIRIIFKSGSKAIHSMFLLLGVRILGTTLTHTFFIPRSACKFCLTLSLLMFTRSETVQMLSQWSSQTILVTSTFSWVFAVEAQPDFELSLMSSLSSINLLNHSKTCLQDRLLSTNFKFLWQIFQFCEELYVNTF